MSAPRKYDQEFRERPVRMYRERLAEPGESKRGAPAPCRALSCVAWVSPRLRSGAGWSAF